MGLVLSGQPLPVEDANIIITQPKIKDIVLFGEDDFLVAVNLIVAIKDYADQIRSGNFELEVYNDFQLLLTMIRGDATVKELINRLFLLIFPDYEVQIEESSINFYMDIDEHRMMVGRIHPFNFENFQIVLSDAFIPYNDQEIEYNPVNDFAQQIADKIKKGREKIAAQRQAKEGEQSVYARYASILSIGLAMDINVFFNYTPFQLYDAYKRYFYKVSYDYYMRIKSMPMMDTSSMQDPEEWTKNLYQ